MATIKYLLLIAIVATLEWTLSESARICDEAKDLCVHARNCRKYSKRYANREHFVNATFMQELRQLHCQPEFGSKQSHVCCPKKESVCSFGGERGVCLLKNHCPELSATPEEQLLTQNYCGRYNGKRYFCCTNQNCVFHPELCEPSSTPLVSRPSLAFPACSSGGKPGSLVSGKLCDSTISEASEQVCCLTEEPDRTMLHLKAARLASMPCGTVVTEDNKIINGTHALEGEFPWMARLVYRRGSVCSGTLIHPSYVLTARHCLKVYPIAVRLGVRDLREEANFQEMQEIKIANRIRCDRYDVALLRLSQPAVIEGSMVRPICLPLFANLRMNLPQLLTIAGWGLTETGFKSNILLKAQSSVINNPASVGEECMQPHEICIGGEDAHSHHCDGDSGGPYLALDVYDGSMRIVQFGVISHGGQFCSTQKKVGRGVLVGYVLDWILDNMIL